MGLSSLTPNVICLFGPTASGKSAAALALAQRLPVEIISVDSAQIYRGMDIGTAKPNAAERAQVPHHLIDIIDPQEAYSAARFSADAARLIADIQARQRIALLVGGTMLYYRALAQGLHEMPGASAALRATLNAQAAKSGWPALHAQLAAVDPVTAARLAPHDAQRIQRALEVWMLTGQPLSALHRAGARLPGSTSKHAASVPRFSVIALEPSDRAVLHTRIAQRFDAMLAAGFVEEVVRLRARGDLSADLPSIRCVGYRQLWEYLAGSITLAQAREQSIAATRQLCKRQLTWLRGMPERTVIDCCAADAQDQVVLAVLRMLGSAI